MQNSDQPTEGKSTVRNAHGIPTSPDMEEKEECNLLTWTSPTKKAFKPRMDANKRQLRNSCQSAFISGLNSLPKKAEFHS